MIRAQLKYFFDVRLLCSQNAIRELISRLSDQSFPQKSVGSISYFQKSVGSMEPMEPTLAMALNLSFAPWCDQFVLIDIRDALND